ncbi:hypothetical protein BRADI_3g15490v3 [Brachypodium distachyon]|uniref:B box-type domain-containing protein n=1 Tax=Brachypodium distachyon TaxID=15368 RepID=A0A0Q3LRK9_BRADI|nr:hypothetical protein BRADI_3g15490v3 [Brachypodium distachyon]
MAASGGRDGGKGSGKGGCELCGAAARVYCCADDATLCWGCDAQVHGANFLVARHARALLCRGCARPTPWRAAGPRLGPTASLCERCVGRGRGGGDGEEEDEEMTVEEEEEEEEEEGEGENQVVPWAEDAEATPPPVASSTSSSSREAAPNAGHRCAKEDLPCSTSQPSSCRGGQSDEATSARNSSGGRHFFASGHRKRSTSDFLSSGSAQSGSGPPGRNRSTAAISRNE